MPPMLLFPSGGDQMVILGDPQTHSVLPCTCVVGVVVAHPMMPPWIPKK